MRSSPDLLQPRTGPPAWVQDAFAIILMLALAFGPPTGTEFRAETPLEWVLVLVPIALIPARRRWPLWVLGACVLMYCALVLLGIVAPGVALAAAIAMFGAANRVDRRAGVISMFIGVALVIAAGLLASLGSTFDPRTVQIVLGLAFAGAAGDATKFRREYLQAVTERAIRAEQTKDAEARRAVSDERLRIARDLHDAVAHQISVISLNAGVASANLESRPEKTREALGTIRTASRTVLGEIGDLLAVLRADDAGAPAPQPELDRLDELAASFRATGLDVVVRDDSDRARVPASVSRVAYRVVQEGLTNALKHGAERRAHVLLETDAANLRGVVTNPTSALTPLDEVPSGYGLVGLRERVATVRGTLEAGTAPGGFRLAATLPIPPAAEPEAAEEEGATP
ncbi:MAG: hypothetical protein ABS62_00245 [Microbacterium sp. SCN 70-200]|uniref:sensor histidine kinase n=1 Tax=unclassified Microbacterium TaxID=2609290 RepID=UPI00086E62E8|nr:MULTISPECIES: histidine kinase [unclassified Microbacterium]MBN9215050.1 sensor histidine kinase [Microbacterium sp.]ODT42864.1 MAG: hypothetical protein ABS62_00245 [Microbacterium sp. SCN 70-200]OJV84829.1 MAG: hypothetical protein BGO46_05505 [Microbacterium sp. 70-16]